MEKGSHERTIRTSFLFLGSSNIVYLLLRIATTIKDTLIGAEISMPSQSLCCNKRRLFALNESSSPDALVAMLLESLPE